MTPAKISLTTPDFRTLFESAPDSYYVLSPDFTILAASDAFLRASMTKREDIVGRGLFEVFPGNPDDPSNTGVSNLRDSLESVLKHRVPHTMVVQKYDIPRPDSVGGGFEQKYWSPVSYPVFGVDGRVAYIIHRTEDVTEFVRLKQQGSEQQKLTQQLQTRAEQMEAEIYLRAQELQSANRQLRAANEALAELDRAKTAFFSNISHEFRTPLTLMLAPIEDILNNSTLVAGDREQLEIVHRNGLRLLKLVNNLLDFSRLKAGKVQAVYESTDLATFTLDLASGFRSAVERAGLSFIVDCPPLESPIYVDREMWEKIVLNLLSNAFKFTFEGKIAVTLHSIGECIELTVQDTGTGIPAEELPHLFERFHRVQGTRARTQEGSGIGLALVQELVKLHGGTVSVSSIVGEGTTFTVVIPIGSERLLTGYNSALPTQNSIGIAPYVEEALRWLPEEEDGETRGQGDKGTRGQGEFMSILAPSSHSSPAPSARILVADDNADMRDYLKRLLSRFYQVEVVADGVAALAAVRQEMPDLVLTDVMMPGLDGFALLHRLRADVCTREVPILLLSARAGEESRVEGLSAGADDYLLKPFSARELLARVRANLEMARVRQEAVRSVETERAFLEAVVQQMPVGVMIGEAPSGRIVHSNDQVTQVLRHPLIPVADIKEYEQDKVFHLDGRPYNYNEYPLVRALASGEIVTGEEISYLCGDGTNRIMYTNAAPIRDRSGQIIAGVLTFDDITERKKAEKKLQQLNANLENLAQERTAQLRQALEFEAMLFRITDKMRVSLDERQILQTAVRELALILGVNCCNTALYNLETGTSTIYYEYATENPEAQARIMQMAAFPQVYQQLLRGQDSQFCSITPNPLRGKVAMLACPIFDDRGVLGDLWLISQPHHAFNQLELRLVQQVAASCAITLRQARLYTAATAQVKELEKLNALKDDFLSTVSHELRTPLSNMKMAISMLKNPASVERQQRYLQILQTECKREIELINDLLDLQRLEVTSYSNLQLLEAIDLQEILPSVIEPFQVRARQHEQTLTLDLTSDLRLLICDRPSLERILAELLNNACKYTQAGGEIGLSICYKPNEAVTVFTINNSTEIPTNFLPRIFDKFYRVPNTDRWKQGGTGLGLALVQKLVECLRGTISVESKSGWTTFTVVLPNQLPA
jgi:signal transduction histidine kinase/DNA-binding response OmpR family regulator